VSTLTAELFELHDRAEFEVTAFSLGPDTQDAMRRRMELAFDRFRDVRGKSCADIAALSRAEGIDIAVDLSGLTGDGRMARVFALRPAPLQVGYLGYLGTLGAPFMDYLIADPTLVPPAERAHYLEKIIFLPSYQPNDSRRAIAERRFSRSELGLPATGTVFCCFNANYKITPETWDSWMRILRSVDGSVLFLSADSDAGRRNLEREARCRGVDAGRLVFGGRLSPPEYLARYRVADLFLDTLPYNGGTTASDALWAGLPVLTMMGRSFASRMAASLLRAVGLPELITTTRAQYEELAVALANEPVRLCRLRDHLAANGRTAPLFNTPVFARRLEAAYRTVHQRHLAGLEPADIAVD
jgi:predicted O-linked N-acetylglucosamine transferase (SPINDLY family)